MNDELKPILEALDTMSKEMERMAVAQAQTAEAINSLAGVVGSLVLEEEELEEPRLDLDGNEAGAPRDQSQSLD